MQNCPEIGNICITCLSIDRELYKMTQTNVISEFKTIGLDMHRGKLCWECRAIINKIEIFKRKAIIANKILIDNLKVTALQCLSTLNIKNNDSYDEIALSKKVNENLTHQNIEENIAFNFLGVKVESVEVKNDNLILKHKEETLPLKDSNLKVESVEIENVKLTPLHIDFKNLDVKVEIDKLNHFHKTVTEFDDPVDFESKSSDKNNRTHETIVSFKEQITNKYKTTLLDTVTKNKKINVNKTKTRKNKTSKNVNAKRYTKDSASSINEIDKELLNSNNYIECIITEDELMNLRDKEKNSSLFMKSTIKCDTCIIPFHNDQELIEHSLNVHIETIGSYICDICHCRFPELDTCNEHKRRHLMTYKCGMCNYSCFVSSAIEMHMKRNHGKEYSCNSCSKTFNSRGAYKYHIKVRNTKGCKLCGKKFSNLKLHMLSHSKVRTEECPICQKSLKSKSSLRFHLLTHETSRKHDAYCAECDTYYKNKHIYKLHLNSAKHTVPNKECDYCQRKFISKFNLAKHINIVHYKRLDHVCHLCGKKFSIARLLRNHILVHHEGGSKPKKHICDLCGKGFALKKYLTDHINSHTGARPYKCTSCTAQFGFKSALYMHNRLKHQKGRKEKKHPAISVAPT